jgi:hypothetical protein
LLPDGRLRVTDQGADDRAGLGDERRAIGGERDARRKRKRVGDELELAHAAQADYALRREGERFGADDAGVKVRTSTMSSGCTRESTVRHATSRRDRARAVRRRVSRRRVRAGGSTRNPHFEAVRDDFDD